MHVAHLSLLNRTDHYTVSLLSLSPVQCWRPEPMGILTTRGGLQSDSGRHSGAFKYLICCLNGAQSISITHTEFTKGSKRHLRQRSGNESTERAQLFQASGVIHNHFNKNEYFISGFEISLLKWTVLGKASSVVAIVCFLLF
uniref:Uncharacterized protein n=1 Tax=Periophthalmus magnuspinnatus TaxID=409849 RepID=A0A3B3ZLN7_9GOBI